MKTAELVCLVDNNQQRSHRSSSFATLTENSGGANRAAADYDYLTASTIVPAGMRSFRHLGTSNLMGRPVKRVVKNLADHTRIALRCCQDSNDPTIDELMGTSRSLTRSRYDR